MVEGRHTMKHEVDPSSSRRGIWNQSVRFKALIRPPYFHSFSWCGNVSRASLSVLMSGLLMQPGAKER
jgi:hypothetical protein